LAVIGRRARIFSAKGREKKKVGLIYPFGGGTGGANS